MSEYATAGIVSEGLGVSRYRRHRPEQTLLYRIVAQHYPALVELLADQGNTRSAYVRREFEDYLRCDRLEHGFLRVKMRELPRRNLVANSRKRRGFCPCCGEWRLVGWRHG